MATRTCGVCGTPGLTDGELCPTCHETYTAGAIAAAKADRQAQVTTLLTNAAGCEIPWLEIKRYIIQCCDIDIPPGADLDTLLDDNDIRLPGILDLVGGTE